MLDKNNYKLIYRTLKDSIEHDFYIPCLSESIELKRAAGFFSLKCLSLSIDGLIRFIRNKGTIQLICSPHLTQEDAALIDAGINLTKDQITKELIESIVDKKLSEKELSELDIICNMMVQGCLNIKIAFQPMGMFHEKFGIFSDKNGNKVYFNGSMNETQVALQYNHESIRVNCSWDSASIVDMIEHEEAYFDSLWNNKEDNVIIMEFPEALKQKMLVTYKRSESLEKAIDNYISRSYTPSKKSLYDYQKKAIQQFCQNGYKHFYEMATGTGKTFTAIKTLERLLSEKKEPVYTVILVPQIDLQEQWRHALEAEGYNDIYLFGGVTHNTDEKVSESVIEYYNNEKSIIAISVYDSFFEKVHAQIEGIEDLFVIVDEAHNLNPGQMKKIPYCPYRLGLSATIQRFSKTETELILKYFMPGETETFYYGIEDAIENNFLSRYEYHPIFVNLTQKEFEDYQIKTKQIAVEINKDKEIRDQAKLETLLRDRSVIVKKADNKILEISNMLLTDYNFRNSVVYCGQGKRKEDKEESIIDKVSEILGASGLDVSQFTSKTPERSRVLYEFENGYFDTLIAIRCFDEGVDVPKLDKIYIMASDTSFRQTVQRRGRVLRKCKESNKTIAYIYDMIAMPPEFIETSEIGARSLVVNEFRRALEYNRLSENKEYNNKIFTSIFEKYNIEEEEINNNSEDYE